MWHVMGKSRNIITRFSNDNRPENDIERIFLSKDKATSTYQKKASLSNHVPTIDDLEDGQMVRYENGTDIDVYVRSGKSLYKATFRKV